VVSSIARQCGNDTTIREPWHHLARSQLSPITVNPCHGASIGSPPCTTAFVAYPRAKDAADDNVRARKTLKSTIVGPGHLTNDPGTGRVAIADDTGHGSIPREDVAAVLLAVLDAPGTGGQTFEVISGDTPIADAIAALVP
jgi:hypothetical protein